MKKKEQKVTSFSELKIDCIKNKFSFTNRAGKKILMQKSDVKGQPDLNTYLSVLSDMISKEIKKNDESA